MRQKHQKRVLINLLVIAVLALFLWVYHEYPLPTQEMEFHRTERQRLAEESQVIWEDEGRALSNRIIVAGTTASQVHTYGSVYNEMIIWPKAKKEPTLVVLPDLLMDRTQHGDRELCPAFLAVDPPARAENATLTISISYSDSLGNVILENAVFQMEGEKQNGFFFFQLEAESSDEIGGLWFVVSTASPDKLRDYPYTLEFFDGSGALLATYTNPAGEEGTE